MSSRFPSLTVSLPLDTQGARKLLMSDSQQPQQQQQQEDGPETLLGSTGRRLLASVRPAQEEWEEVKRKRTEEEAEMADKWKLEVVREGGRA